MQVFCGTCEHGAASLLLSPVSGKVSLVAKVPITEAHINQD